MGDDERVPATVEAALARIEGSLGAGFAELRGQIALVLQRADQADVRAREQADQLTAHEGRLRVLETTSATQAALKAVDDRVDGAVTHDQMDRQLDGRFRRTTTILTLVLTGVAIVTGAGTSLLIALFL